LCHADKLISKLRAWSLSRNSGFVILWLDRRIQKPFEITGFPLSRE
jgi:hypothetical protein